MSWLDLVKTKFTITTGDGKTYAPNMLNANLSVEYNVAQFNFRNVKGTLVERNQPMGAVYNLEIIFQGGDHVEQATAFRNSANDRRAWTITHPLYGQLFVQPIVGLYFDNAENRANTTKVTGPVMETIGKRAVAVTTAPAEIIAAGKITTDQHYAADYVNVVPAPGVKDTNQMRTNTNGIYKLISKISTAGATVINTYNATNAAINNAIGNVGGAINSIQKFSSLPATIEDTIAHRITYLTNEFNFLLLQAGIITLPTLKQLYQVNGSACITSMCLASVYNISDTDYAYGASVLQVISSIVTSYNAFLRSLDDLQTDNGGEPDSFVPDYISGISLDNLVNYTITTLFDIASSAKQQRTFVLTKDNNWINIAYQIYGLLPDDSTITTIMRDNNAGPNEILQVRKGRSIIYYV